jgi:hypothetical protein
MKISISLQNKDRPELGRSKLYLPADEEELNSKLAEILIPYASPERNCLLSTPDCEPSPFDFIKGGLVNADELNYLAMRLDSFDGYEMTQFQAAAHCENITDVTGLINLTFNTHNYTVVTDFFDIAAIGKSYYLDEHIAVPADEFEKINAADIGNNLLRSGNGTVTPFGVVYKHGKELETPYKGVTFPQYSYTGEAVMHIGLVSASDVPGTDKVAWLELPVPGTAVEKALHRLGAEHGNVHIAYVYPEDVPEGIMQRVNTEIETVQSLSDMCRAISAVKGDDFPKLDAACEFVEASVARDIIILAENVGYFELYPGVSSAKEYGYKIAEDAGAFQFDQSLSEYFDFEALGKDRMANEYGRFSEYGYTVFKMAPEVLDEMLSRGQGGGMGMKM